MPARSLAEICANDLWIPANSRRRSFRNDTTIIQNDNAIGHAHDHGHEKDNNLRSAYFHVIADALTSVLAIAALLGGRYLGWVWLDPVMGIVGAFVIARWAWTLMGVTAGVLLDQTDAHVAEEIRELVEKPGGATITDLHVWRVGPQACAAIVSVLGEATVNAESIRERLKTVHEVSHLTVEFRQT